MSTPNGYQNVDAIVQLCNDTAAEWALKNPIAPMAVFMFETDTRKFKIGDNVTAYNNLEYAIEKALSAEHLAILVNAGSANGAALLDANGKLPLSVLPTAIAGSVTYVADIATRDALAELYKEGLVFVIDASADATVDVGSALYAWADKDGDLTKEWIKISEVESLDVDLSMYFDKTKHTLDDLTDGATYVRMSVAEQTKLAGIEAGADVTDAENVRAAGAVMIGDQLFIPGANAAEIAALTYP